MVGATYTLQMILFDELISGRNRPACMSCPEYKEKKEPVRGHISKCVYVHAAVGRPSSRGSIPHSTSLLS